MTELTQIRQVLGELLEAISRGSGAPGDEPLTARLAHLDRLRDELGEGAPPMLRHYLEKRSYEKALAFLEGRDETQKPVC